MSSRGRRTQIITLLVSLALIYVLFFSSESTPSQSFRSRTESAIARKHSPLRGDLSDEDLTTQTNDKLAEIVSKKANVDEYWRLAPTHRAGRIVLKGTRTAAQPTAKAGAEDLEHGEIPVAGRKSMPKPTPPASTNPDQRKQDILKEKEKPKYPKTGDDEEEAFNGNRIESAADPGEELARHELQSILKKSPIIIFSKSYCPYSKRAKHILLDLYDITPKPYVVELDLDLMTEKVPKKKGDDNSGTDAPTLGRKVQDLLKTLTGRGTVPNIMINSQPLGGSDEIVKLDTENGLGDKIRTMGGKRIVSVERKDGRET